jgi:hypothetical protein
MRTVIPQGGGERGWLVDWLELRGGVSFRGFITMRADTFGGSRRNIHLGRFLKIGLNKPR